MGKSSFGIYLWIDLFRFCKCDLMIISLNVCSYVIHLMPPFIRYAVAGSRWRRRRQTHNDLRVATRTGVMVFAVAAAISDSAHHVYSYFTIHFSHTDVASADGARA